MKTKLTIAVVVLVMVMRKSVAVYFQTQNVVAKETPFEAGYDHGCADSKLLLSERYIDVHGKGQFNTQEFMTESNIGINICRSHGQSSPVVVSIIGNANSSRLSFK